MAIRSFVELEIEIGPPSPAGCAVSARSQDGRTASGALTLPGSEGDFAALAARLARLDTDEALLTRLGTILFDTLFHGDVRDVYVAFRDARKPHQGLRLRLKIHPAAAKVAALPWELLYAADRYAPMVLLDHSVVRSLPQQRPYAALGPGCRSGCSSPPRRRRRGQMWRAS
jgi:hypothetical protein